jgi:hypothetical protein
VVIFPHRRKAFRSDSSSPDTSGLPTTDLVWSIDADTGVRTTGGGLAADMDIVESWDDLVGSSDFYKHGGTDAIYHTSGGPNGLAYVEFPASNAEYRCPTVTAQTLVALYKIDTATINFPLQDTSWDLGGIGLYWAEYRSALASNKAQIYDNGGGGFWWWGDRPGGGGKTTWFTFARTAEWMIIAIRINFGGVDTVQVNTTRDRGRFTYFRGGIRKAVAYSSILSNTDLASIFELWSIESGITLRNPSGTSTIILDRSEY